MLEQLHQPHKDVNKGSNRTDFTAEVQLPKEFCWQEDLSKRREDVVFPVST